jgi:3'-5' exoribonuclease
MFNIYPQYKRLRSLSEEFNVFNITEHVLVDRYFLECSGSSNPKQHHYGKYGLIIHTTEVVDLCLLNNDFYNSQVNRKLLFLAAFFHDVGKMWDYNKVEDVVIDNQGPYLGNWHKKHIHHITRSAIHFHDIINVEGGLSTQEENIVMHSILSHHGKREWGSPVEPQTKMAWLLHLSDYISAKMGEPNLEEL